MDQPRTATLEPTLDAERTDQLRTFLSVEAAADAASVPSRSRHRARRLAGGVAAAVVLGAGLFAVASVTGGSGSGPVSVESAGAVAIEPAEPGWVRISIRDIDADPHAVVAELQAAGIDARRQDLPVQRDGEGRLTLESFDTADLGAQASFTMVGVGQSGEEGLAGLSVSAPGAAPSPLSADLPPEEAEAAFTAHLESMGARMDADGALEIRTDADLTVLVLNEA